MHPFESLDKSPYKMQRRDIIHELCAHQPAVLMTDYPTPAGRAFIRKLHRERPSTEITLVNKIAFKRDQPGDSLAGVVHKLRKDIFDVLPYHYAPLVDIDLFGGLSKYAIERIESSAHWKQILMTFTKNFRHKKLKGALPNGVDPTMFFVTLCKKNGWKPPTMVQQPYRHPNKNALLGIIDNRGPKYWTFLIER
jgi:hypothetical protein